MKLSLSTVLIFAAVAGVAYYFYSQEDGRLETHDDWAVFAEETEGTKTCWIETWPIGGSPLFRRNGGIVKYTVAPDVLSFIAVGTEFPAPSGWLSVGEQRFGLLFNGPSGWLRAGDDDEAIRGLFAGQPSAEIQSGVHGFTFSTKGFDAALAAAKTLCPES